MHPLSEVEFTNARREEAWTSVKRSGERDLHKKPTSQNPALVGPCHGNRTNLCKVNGSGKTPHCTVWCIQLLQEEERTGDERNCRE